MFIQSLREIDRQKTDTERGVGEGEGTAGGGGMRWFGAGDCGLRRGIVV